MLCRAQVGVRLSRDFKPFDDDECPRILGPGRRRFSSYVVRHRRYDRIQSLGGFVSLRDGGRVCDDLALTRALGDLHLARYIEPVAHCNTVEIDVAECPFVTVCCDGVWDVLSDQQAVDAVLATAPDYERGAAALRDLAFLHGSTDNVACHRSNAGHVLASSARHRSPTPWVGERDGDRPGVAHFAVNSACAHSSEA